MQSKRGSVDLVLVLIGVVGAILSAIGMSARHPKRALVFWPTLVVVLTVLALIGAQRGAAA